MHRLAWSSSLLHLCVKHLRCEDKLWPEPAPGNSQQNQTEYEEYNKNKRPAGGKGTCAKSDSLSFIPSDKRFCRGYL